MINICEIEVNKEELYEVKTSINFWNIYANRISELI